MYRNAVILLLLSSPAVADSALKADVRKAVLLPGLGKHHHPVTTKNPEAQQYFDQGLTLIYAFNHAEAILSFQRAAELDPELAMAYWGVALALGPNYNLDADAPQLKDALVALHRARILAPKASPAERDYIDALAKRYADDPKADRAKLALAYKNAMGELSQRYPDDLDAATLYAESAMNLRPWELWTKDGKPAPGTEEIIAVLAGVLKRNPDHPGANHYYIHAVEAGPWPERALPSAERLKTLVPAAGHLVHMPAHIYFRVGDYEQAARQNELAMTADEAYFFRRGITGGVYPLMYYSHNIHFLAVARAFQGRYRDAVQAAEQLAAHARPHVKDMPTLEVFTPTPILVRIKFHRWDELLQLPDPGAGLPVTRALWRCGRGLAYAAAGKLADAEKERQAFAAARKQVPDDLKYGDRNSAQSVLAIADLLLKARIASAGQDPQAAIAALEQAIKAEDALNYIEPPDWYIPVRETLGALLLAEGKPAEAEKVYRADLALRPRNGRALFGLIQSLKAQKNEPAARLVQQELDAAWNRADEPLTPADL